MSIVNSSEVQATFPTFPVYGISSGSIDANRDPRGVSIAFLIATGATISPVYQTLDTGGPAGDAGLALIETGKLSIDASGGAFETSGQAFRQNPYYTLDLQTRFLFAYSAYFALSAYFVQYGESKSSLAVSGLSRNFASGGETIRQKADNPSLGVLTILSPRAVALALAVITIGATEKTESLASQEITTGEGVEFMVDIINAILYGGHGDDC